MIEFSFIISDPGNMLRTDDGRLVILDFGLMTQITDDQKYGMIEAIAHLIHRDYSEIGNDFVNLDFIPRGVDTGGLLGCSSYLFITNILLHELIQYFANKLSTLYWRFTSQYERNCLFGLNLYFANVE